MSEINTNIQEAQPYWPLDDDVVEVWAILNSLGYRNTRMLKYFPKKLIEFEYNLDSHTRHTITLDISWAFKHNPYKL